MGMLADIIGDNSLEKDLTAKGENILADIIGDNSLETVQTAEGENNLVDVTGDNSLEKGVENIEIVENIKSDEVNHENTSEYDDVNNREEATLSVTKNGDCPVSGSNEDKEIMIQEDLEGKPTNEDKASTENEFEAAQNVKDIKDDDQSKNEKKEYISHYTYKNISDE